MKTTICLLLVATIVCSSNAFIAPSARRLFLVVPRVGSCGGGGGGCSPNAPFSRPTTSMPWNTPAATGTATGTTWTWTSSISRRYMGFNLPPSGGGNKDSVVPEWIGSVVTIVAIVGFFASPLGSIVFTLFNSLVVLAVLTPVLLVVAFQTWQTFFTFDGPCPNCDATVRVLKSGGGQQPQPTICLNCGAIVQSNMDGTGIELAPQDGVIGNDDNGDDSSDSDLIESLLGNWMGLREQPTTQSSTTAEERQQKFRREQTIIDVEVDRED